MAKTKTTAKHHQLPPTQSSQLKMNVSMANKICTGARHRSPNYDLRLIQSLKPKYRCIAGKNQGLPSYNGIRGGGGPQNALGWLPVPIAVSAIFFPQPARPNRSRPSIASCIKNTVIFKKRGYLGARKPYISKPAIRDRTA